MKKTIVTILLVACLLMSIVPAALAEKTITTGVGNINHYFPSTDRVSVYGETAASEGVVANSSFQLELYSGNTKIATTTLKDYDDVLEIAPKITWHFMMKGSDSYWDTVWEEGHPRADMQPTKVVAIADGTRLNEEIVKMSSADELDGKQEWAKLPGVYSARIGTKYYETIQAAITDAANDAEIVVLADVEQVGDGDDDTILIPAGKKVTINLDNKTVTGAFFVKGEAIFRNGTITNSNLVSGIENNGSTAKTTIENVNISTNRHALRVDGGTVVINGGKFESSANANQTHHAINISTGASVEIIKGTFIGSTTGSDCTAVAIRGNSTLVIRDGEFSGGTQATLNIWDGTATIHNGIFHTVQGNATMRVDDSTTVINGSFPEGLRVVGKPLGNLLQPGKAFYLNNTNVENRVPTPTDSTLDRIGIDADGKPTGEKIIIDTAKYQVTYKYNDGVTADLVKTVTYNNGAKAPKPQPDPTKDNNKFLYWSADGATEYNFSTELDDDLVLNALWGNYAKVTFWVDGKEFITKHVEPGTTVAAPQPAPTDEKRVFLGWFEADSTNPFPMSEYKFEADETLDLYAHWEDKLVVTFESNGKVVHTEYIVKNNLVAEFVPSKLAGKVFEAWYIKGTDEAFDFSRKIQRGVELEARWVSEIRLISGNGQSLFSDNEGVFVSSAEYDEFLYVRVDGRNLDPSKYTKAEGSTIITLKQSYISTLALGTHTIEIFSQGGAAVGTFTVNGEYPPKTGDSTPLMLAGMLMLLSAMGMVALSRKRSA